MQSKQSLWSSVHGQGVIYRDILHSSKQNTHACHKASTRESLLPQVLVNAKHLPLDTAARQPILGSAFCYGWVTQRVTLCNGFTIVQRLYTGSMYTTKPAGSEGTAVGALLVPWTFTGLLVVAAKQDGLPGEQE